MPNKIAYMFAPKDMYKNTQSNFIYNNQKPGNRPNIYQQ